MTSKFYTRVEFSAFIEDLVHKYNISYYEAVCDHMMKHHLEPESIPPLLNDEIKNKIEDEVIALNLRNRGKKKNRLPI